MAESAEAPISTSLRLMKARQLAHQGKLRAAQAILAVTGTLPDNPVELHALAALVTSEGDYPRALRLWRLLLQREPSHAEARRMIASIELWLSRPPWIRYLPAGAAVLLLVILVSILAFAGGGSSPAARSATGSGPAAAERRPATAAPAPLTLPKVTVPEAKKGRAGR
jgi:hypothetical protein